ncbi:MAG TPA: ABC transporter permease [Flavitalea sp.]|nr:ABC transporter permease [Flavitalea sp.]
MYKKSKWNDKDEWNLVIKPESSPWYLKLDELWHYRDLILLFVKRDFVALYKQTILGPLWFVIQPVLTTIMFIIVFHKVAGIPTGGVPSAVFYLSGLVVWNYFSSCLTASASSFSANTHLFGKVYFPRLIVPLSKVLSNLVSFGIQFSILLIIMLYYILFEKERFNFSGYLFFIPFILAIIAGLALGAGMIISALTVKYRDLVLLINFGVNLLMYATPVIYPLTFVNEKYKPFVLANPLSPLIECFRYALLGVGEFTITQLGYSILCAIGIMMTGIVVFNKVENNFMDVV